MPLHFSPQHPVRRVIAHVLLVITLIAGVHVLRQSHYAQAAAVREMDREALQTELATLVKNIPLKNGDTAHELVRSLDESRLRELALLAGLSPRERLQRLFDPAKPAPSDTLTQHFIMASLVDPVAMPVDEAFEIIAPHETRLPVEMRIAIYDTLAKNARSTGDADLAAVIIQHGFDMSRSDLATLQRLVATFRQADRPVSAYRSTQEWLRHHRDTMKSSDREVAANLEFELAMESGHPDEALNECLKSLKSYRAHEPLNEALLNRACQAAHTASRSKEVLPFMKRFVAAFPEAKVDWWDLAKIIVQNSRRAARYREWVRRTADVADRNVLAEDAYFYHLRLAAMGDVSCLDRFYPLANYLNRVEECTEVLRSLPQQPDGVSVHVRLARLIAANGKPDHAMRLFQEWLRLHPQDDAVRLDLISLMEETGDRAGAIGRLEEWLARAPDHQQVMKKLAVYYLRGGHMEKVLHHLDALAEEGFDSALIAVYQAAAEAIDSPRSLMRALRIGLKKEARPAEERILRLAQVSLHMDGLDEALVVLREGVSRQPEKTALRVELASLLLDSGRFEEALREASHPLLAGDVKAVEIIALARNQNQNTIAQSEIRKALPVSNGAGVENIP